MYEKMAQFGDEIFANGLIGSPVVVLGAIIIFLVIFRISRHFVNKLVEKNRMEEINALMLIRIIKALIWGLIIITIAAQIIPLQGALKTLLGASGILVAAIGLAANEAMANVVAGVFIALFHPFTIGDYIKIEDKLIDGTVEDISLRHTVIRTFENNRVIIPNSIINNSILKNTNYNEEKSCNFLPFEISYESSIDLARNIIVDEVSKHPGVIDVRSEEDKKAGVPKVVVRVAELQSSGIKLTVAVWTKDAMSSFGVLSDLRQSIKERFDAEGVSIPYPHMTIVQKEQNNEGK